MSRASRNRDPQASDPSVDDQPPEGQTRPNTPEVRRPDLRDTMDSPVFKQIATKWFDYGARGNFVNHVLERPVKRYLEIGVWEGASLFWVFENKRPEYAIGIDPYDQDKVRSYKVNQAKGQMVHDLWREHFPRVSGGLVREPSREALPRYVQKHRASFDLIYIDGSHHGADVFFDAAMATELIRPGGLIIFDDFITNIKRNVYSLRVVVDAFVRATYDDYELVFANRQVGIQRRVDTLRYTGKRAELAESLL